MKNLELILKSTEFAEKNLKEELNVGQMAAKTGFSLYHFIRLFQGVTGLSPGDYLLRRRLTEAAEELALDKELKILEVALDYGFQSHETFTRAFKRTFGLNPAEFRRAPGVLKGRLSPMNRELIEQRGKIKEIQPELIERDGLHLMGMSTLVRGGTRIITELWNHFSREIVNQQQDFFQLLFWPEDYDIRGFFVMCAVEFNENTPAKTPFVEKRIPPARYLRFKHIGLSRDVGLTYKFIYETYLPGSEFRPIFPYDFEYYGPNHKGPDDPDSVSEIFIPVQ